MDDGKVFVQVDEVLKMLKKEDLEKIPNEVRENISRKRSKFYVWEYDREKTLEEQKLDRKAVVILSYLNMEFLLNPEQKALMEKIHLVNEQKNKKF